MSGGVVGVAATIADDLTGGLVGDIAANYALITSPKRAISYIIPHVVVEEVHTDDLAVTDHPVEAGAAISDHAFKLPSRVEMRCGWSNSTERTQGYVQVVYQELLALQKQREPFDLYTGKRLYANMLLSRIAVETNAQFENALMVVASLREVIITDTAETSDPTTTRAAADPANQRFPERTASPVDRGTVQPIPMDAGTGQLGRFIPFTA